MAVSSRSRSSWRLWRSKTMQFFRRHRRRYGARRLVKSFHGRIESL
jgi:hypothetical protein